MCNSNFGGGSCWSIILVILLCVILFSNCSGGNDCGCGNSGSGCGCGCS